MNFNWKPAKPNDSPGNLLPGEHDSPQPMTLRQRIMFYRDDALDGTWFDYIRTPLQKMICLFKGHVPERDQCGRPEHDFCLWCTKLLPNSWKPK